MFLFHCAKCYQFPLRYIPNMISIHLIHQYIILSKLWLLTIDVKQWDAITRQCPNFNGDLVKPPLELEHG